MRLARSITFALLLATAGCALPPFRGEGPSAAPGGRGSSSGPGGGPSIPEPPPVPVPGSSEPTIEAPPPTQVPRERPRAAPAALGPASKALVSQAEAQRKRGDLPGASVSIERALRIEPSNPLLWIEMGRLRMDQRNFSQAEAMGRKAVAMAPGDSQTQSSAWALIADALKARGRNPESQEAMERSIALSET